ncbi:MAG: hypothetical protein OFPI_22880 [Osedax symbiont Rs2]|nr:MAG: hypothetical protein OFPI_22880 [Osedax symbiont Rs2]
MRFHCGFCYLFSGYVFLKVFFTAALILMLITPAYARDTIVLSTEEYPPYTSQFLKHYGIANHIISEAMALEGINVEFKFFPSQRSFVTAEQGDVDGSTVWVWRKVRERGFYYGESIMAAGKDGFFHKRGLTFNWDPANPDYSDLAGKEIVAIIGFNYGELFMQAEKNKLIKVTRVANIEQAFRMLLAGRVDLLMLQDVPGFHSLNMLFSIQDSQSIIHTAESIQPASDEDYYLIVSKKANRAKAILGAMNRGLKKLKKSGRHALLLAALKRGEYILE